MEKLKDTTINNVLVGGAIIFVTSEITVRIRHKLFPNPASTIVIALGLLSGIGIGYLAYKSVKPKIFQPEEVKKLPETAAKTATDQKPLISVKKDLRPKEFGFGGAIDKGEKLMYIPEW